jgi:NitT/TauT family transport system substrate-binding protein
MSNMSGTSRSAFVASVAGLAALAGAGIAPARAQGSSITVATIGGDIGAQLYYAKELGLFEKAGLNVVIAPFNAATPAAVLAGDIDVTYYAVFGAAIAYAKGLPFTFIAPANSYVATAANAGFLAVVNSSPIRTAKDLEGKTIAVNPLLSFPQFAARAWIDQGGGDSTKVRFVAVPFSEMADAVLAARVDAAAMEITADPTLGKPGDRFRVIARSFDVVSTRFLAGGWMASRTWIASHTAEAKAFISVMRLAAIWANAHRRESAAILAKYSNVSETLIDSATRTTYGTELTAAQIQPSIDLAFKYGLIASRIDAGSLISNVATS